MSLAWSVAALVLGAVPTSQGAVFLDFRPTARGQANFTFAEELLVLALQGLANREAPQLFLNVTNEGMDQGAPGLAWTDWITREKGITFETQFQSEICPLLDRFKAAVRGTVLYDDFKRKDSPFNDCSMPASTLAMTVAGLESLLPVTAEVLQQNACLRGLPLKVNLTSVLEGAGALFPNKTCSVSLNEWGMTHLLPRSNRTAVFTPAAGGSGVWLSADYAVQQKMYTFALEPNATKNPQESLLFYRILRSRELPAAVFGWPSSDEGVGTASVSRAGCYVMCAAAENLSFLNRVRSIRVRLPGAPALPLNLSKYYVTFQTNEGDTPKSAVSFFGGSWLDPARGSAPVSWGFNARICLLWPVMCEMYSKTARPNDSFFSHSSGYMNIWDAPEKPFATFAAQTAALVREFMPASAAVDVWTGYEYNGTANQTIPTPVSLANYSRYQKDAGGAIKMFTQAPAGFDNESAVNLWLDDGTPVFMTPRYLHYACEIPYYPCDKENPEQTIADRVVQAVGNHRPPHFVMVYGLVGGLGPRSLQQVVHNVRARLPENFQVVTTDDFVHAARASAPHMLQQILV